MGPLRGLCVNFRGSMPDRDEILALQPQAIRSIVYSNDDLDAALDIIPATIPVLALLSSEHEELGAEYRDWPEFIQRFASRYAGRIWAVEIENEADLKGIPAATIASLCYHCEPLKNAGILRIVSSVAGPNWQDYLSQLSTFLTKQHVDGGAFHPYGQRVWTLGDPQPGFAPGISASIARAHEILGLPIYVTEFGAKISDFGGEVRQAAYVQEAFKLLGDVRADICPVACYFAWHDGVGAPYEQGDDAFGLVRLDGTKRPAWQAFADLSETVTPDPFKYVYGFKEIHDRHPDIVGVPEENESGIVPGCSFQKTSLGFLYWGYLVGSGDTKGFIANDKTRYLWNGSELRKVNP